MALSVHALLLWNGAHSGVGGRVLFYMTGKTAIATSLFHSVLLLLSALLPVG